MCECLVFCSIYTVKSLLSIACRSSEIRPNIMKLFTDFRSDLVQHSRHLVASMWSATLSARPDLKTVDSHAGCALKLPLLCVCVNHYLRCSQHNGTSWEYGLCDAGERCCQNTGLKERQSQRGWGGVGGGGGAAKKAGLANRQGRGGGGGGGGEVGRGGKVSIESREEGPTARNLLLKHVIWHTGGPVSADACCAAKRCSNPQNVVLSRSWNPKVSQDAKNVQLTFRGMCLYIVWNTWSPGFEYFPS